jgi:hypothetical protein
MIPGLDNWQKSALNTALGIPWYPSGGSKKAKDILGMRYRKNTKDGGAAPPMTKTTNHTYSPWYTDGEIQEIMKTASEPHFNSGKAEDGIFNTNSLKGTVELIDYTKQQLDQISSRKGEPIRTPVISRAQMAVSPRPPLPGPCSVGLNDDGQLIRTQSSDGTPKSCPQGYIAEEPFQVSSRRPSTVKPKRFYTHSIDPFTTSPPPAVVGGGSRKNKSRSSSRNMARRSSRRSTRRSSTRKAGRKGSRKTRRSRR